MLEIERQRLRDLVNAWQTGAIDNVQAFREIDNIFGHQEWLTLDPDNPDSIPIGIYEELGFQAPIGITQEDIAAIREFVETPPGTERKAWERWRAHWAPRVTTIPIQFELAYVSTGPDLPEQGYWRNFPVDPQHTSELTVGIEPFDHTIHDTLYKAAEHGRPQIVLSGPPRALEELGRHLIALARCETQNPDVHTHIDDVANANGGTVHLVIHRDGPSVASVSETLHR